MIARLALMICSLLGVGIVATTPEQSAQWVMGAGVVIASVLALAFEIIEGSAP